MHDKSRHRLPHVLTRGKRWPRKEKWKHVALERSTRGLHRPVCLLGSCDRPVNVTACSVHGKPALSRTFP